MLAAIIALVLFTPFAAADPVGVSIEGDAEGDWLAVSVFGDASSHGYAVSALGNASSDCTYSGETLCTWVSGACFLYGPCPHHPAPGLLVVEDEGDAEGTVAIALDGDADGVVAVAPEGDARGTVAIAGENASGNWVNTVAIAVFGDARGSFGASVFGDARGPGAQVSVFGDAGGGCSWASCGESLAVSVWGEADGRTEIEGDGGSFFVDTPDCAVSSQVLSWLGTCHAGRTSLAYDKATEGAWAISVFGDARGNGCAVWGNIDEPLYHLFTLAPGCQMRSVAVSVFGHAEGDGTTVSGCDAAGLCYDELP